MNTRVNSVPVVFKLNTGAAVTAIPASLRHCVSHMHSTDKSLKGAGNNPLEVIGVSEVTISTN